LPSTQPLHDPAPLKIVSNPYQPHAPIAEVEERSLRFETVMIEDPIPRMELFSMQSAILPDAREISVYLPEAYASEPGRRFPVFYLHDGQNLFDGRKSYLAGRTWRAGENADRETEAGAIEPVILVGVANTGLRRMAEYTPTHDFRMGGGEGHSYGRLLIEELKPFIDSTFRTLQGPAETGLGGSSLGGLISLYLGFEHPEVFSRLAILSPSIWWDQRSILTLIAEKMPKPELRVWLDIGTAEGARHARDTDRLHRLLLERGWKDGLDLDYRHIPDGVHDEDAWAARFGDILRFLFPAR
jgi:predicted alpha/beta superfamily hydrolase